jgi:hypothetical protein
LHKDHVTFHGADFVGLINSAAFRFNIGRLQTVGFSATAGALASESAAKILNEIGRTREKKGCIKITRRI